MASDQGGWNANLKIVLFQQFQSHLASTFEFTQ